MEEEDSKPAARPTHPDPTGESSAVEQDPILAVPDGAVTSMPTTASPSDPEEMKRREERKRKRRRLKNHMRNQASRYPLFTDFLSTEFDVPQNDQVIVIHDDSDISDDDEPVMVIDVDVQLGLKEDAPLSPPATVSSYAAAATLSSSSGTASPRRSTRSATKESVVNIAAASSHFNIHTNNQHGNNPFDEGWYEGTVSPIALTEDALYLNAVHCFVRQQLEFFSETETGRRKRGRVGIRCLHCTVQQQQAAESFSWPTGALSYPNSFASVHQACSQRFQNHIATCPFITKELKARFQLLLQESQHPGRPTKRSRGGLAAPQYYTLSMQRVGLVETADGLRYSRDLTLEPLPLETVRANMEAQAINVDEYHGTSMETTASSTVPAAVSAATEATMKELRATVDEATERVLAECIAEVDQPDKLLARSEDKALVTDYIFITIRQMALCHALPQDMTSRGKKTRQMRVGFCGFCCRFCQNTAGGGSLTYVQSSCRSFLSAPDNLGSAITNSFTQHLQKCRHVPPDFQKAMTVFKRIHQRQMGLLPYGAQRRFFHTVWGRLREADKSAEEIEALVPKRPQPTNGSSATATHEVNGDAVSTNSGGQTNAALVNGFRQSTTEEPCQRPPNFPESNDEETRRVLQMAESTFSEGKVAAAKYLLMPEEFNLVSQYVFLTIMQLSPVAPTTTDSGRSRRPIAGGLMGIACIHCADTEPMVTPSGRSFPSAPDNFASALNTSLYNHMLACGFVPAEIKRALVNLRKLHSSQCSSLRFGSQRKYFNLLFSRLQSMFTGADIPDQTAAPFEPKTSLESLGFLKLTNSSGQQVHFCRHCRMVPSSFQARDAVCYDRLSLSRARTHRSICRGDGFDLNQVNSAFFALAAAWERDPVDLIQKESFRELVSAAVSGQEDLQRVFTVDALATMQNHSGSSTRNRSTHVQSEASTGLWKQFPLEVSFDNVDAAYRKLAADLGVSLTLRESTILLDYLMVISPTFSVPSQGQTVEDASTMTQNREVASDNSTK